ncbi:hypothetical protein BZZ01_32875 (plasmid) [Nostocales cyanobacterium HT-58-2]|nr:hypothetical protein BZZ01_32875 [Nostocales cyanobacterium HT-58-2]
MPKRLPLLYCQRWLLLTWLVGSIPAVLFMATRSFAGVFLGKEQEIWGWFLPTFLPTLSLIIGSYAAIALKEPSRAITVDRFFFYISLGLSAFYLLTLTTVIVCQPFLDAPALVTMQRASLVLGVIQGLTTACLGVFFVSQE